MLMKRKQEGNGVSIHKPRLVSIIWKKMYDSFDFDSPTDLQNKVFIDFMLYFCNRGQENLRELKKKKIFTFMAKENRGMSHCETIIQRIVAGMRMIALKVRKVVHMWFLEVRCVRFNLSRNVCLFWTQNVIFLANTKINRNINWRTVVWQSNSGKKSKYW
jgi:hypothetical protein